MKDESAQNTTSFHQILNIDLTIDRPSRLILIEQFIISDEGEIPANVDNLVKAVLNVSCTIETSMQQISHFEDILRVCVDILINNWNKFDGSQFYRIFQPNSSLYQTGKIDNLEEYPLGLQRKIKIQVPTNGHYFHLVKPFLSSSCSSQSFWAYMKTLSFDQENIYIQSIENEGTQKYQILQRKRSWLSQNDKIPKQEIWRKNIKKGASVDCYKGYWFMSTILDKEINQNGIFLKIGFYELKSNEKNGLSDDQNEWINQKSLRIRQLHTMTCQKSIQPKKIINIPLIDESYDFLFAYEYQFQPFTFIQRKCSNFSLSYISMLDYFQKKNIFQFIYSELKKNQKNCLNKNIYLLMALFYVSNHIVCFEHRKLVKIDVIRDFLIKSSTSLSKVQFKDCYNVYNIMMERMQNQYIDKIMVVNKTKQKIIEQNLSIKDKLTLNSQLIAIDLLLDTIKLNQGLSHSQANFHFHTFLKEKDIFSKIFRISSHEEVIIQSGQILCYIVKNKLISIKQLFENLWTLSFKNLRFQQIIEKLFMELIRVLEFMLSKQKQYFLKALIQKLDSLKQNSYSGFSKSTLNLIQSIFQIVYKTSVTQNIQKSFFDMIRNYFLCSKDLKKQEYIEQIQHMYFETITVVQNPDLRQKILTIFIQRLLNITSSDGNHQQLLMECWKEVINLQKYLNSYLFVGEGRIQSKGQSQKMGQKNHKRSNRLKATQKLYNQSIIEILTNFLQKIEDIRLDPNNKKYLMDILIFIKYVMQNKEIPISIDEAQLLISQIFYIFKGKIEFFEWIQNFTKDIRMQLFVNIFSNSQTICDNFQQINKDGVKIIMKYFYEINYNLGKMVAVIMNQADGIVKQIKKTEQINKEGNKNFIIQQVSSKNLRVTDQTFQQLQLEGQLIEFIPIFGHFQLEGFLFLFYLIRSLKNQEAFKEIFDIFKNSIFYNSDIMSNHIQNVANGILSSIQRQKISQHSNANQIFVDKHTKFLINLIQNTQTECSQKLLSQNCRCLRERQLKIQEINVYRLYQQKLNEVLDFQKCQQKVQFSLTINDKLSIMYIKNKIEEVLFKKFQKRVKITLLVQQKQNSSMTSNINYVQLQDISDMKGDTIYILQTFYWKFLKFEAMPTKQKIKTIYQICKILLKAFSIQTFRQSSFIEVQKLQIMHQVLKNKYGNINGVQTLENLKSYCQTSKITLNDFFKLIYDSVKTDSSSILIPLLPILKHAKNQRCILPCAIRQKLGTIQNLSFFLRQVFTEERLSGCFKNVFKLVQMLPVIQSVLQQDVMSLLKKVDGAFSIYEKIYFAKVLLHQMIESRQFRNKFKTLELFPYALKELLNSLCQEISNDLQQEIRSLSQIFLDIILIDLSSQPKACGLIPFLQSPCLQQISAHQLRNEGEQANLQKYRQFLNKNLNLKQIQQIIEKLLKLHNDQNRISINSLRLYLVCFDLFEESLLSEKLLDKFLFNQCQKIRKVMKNSLNEIFREKNQKFLEENLLVMLGYLEKKQNILLKSHSDKQIRQNENKKSLNYQFLQCIKNLVQIHQQSERFQSISPKDLEQRQKLQEYLLQVSLISINNLPSQKNTVIQTQSQKTLNKLYTLHFQIIFLILSKNKEMIKKLNDKKIYQELFQTYLFCSEAQIKILSVQIDDGFLNKEEPLLENYIKCKTHELRNLIWRIIILMLESEIQKEVSSKYKFIYDFIYPIAHSYNGPFDLQVDKIGLNNGKVGLYNKAVVCFINSFTQIMFNLKEFSNAVLSSKNASPFMQILQQLFIKLSYSTRRYIDPQFYIKGFENQINTAAQQDTTQFFHIFQNSLENIHQEKLIKDLFGCTSVSISQCEGCHHQKVNEEEFYMEGVDIEKKHTLIEALKEMTNQQKISQYRCSHCSQMTNCIKKRYINKASPYLFVHLKRMKFDYNLEQNIKLHNRIEFPQYLDFKKLYPQNIGCQDQFQLKGIIAHQGSGNSGHYYSYFKQKNEKWIQFNDTYVVEHEDESFLQDCYGKDQVQALTSQNGYVLLYKKKYKNIINQREENQSKIVLNQFTENKIKEIVYENHQFLTQSLLISTFQEIQDENTIIRKNYFLDNVQKVNKIRLLEGAQGTSFNIALQIAFKYAIIAQPPGVQHFLKQVLTMFQQNSLKAEIQYVQTYYFCDANVFQRLLSYSNSPISIFVDQILVTLLQNSLKKYQNQEEYLKKQENIQNSNQLTLIQEQIVKIEQFLKFLFQELFDNKPKNNKLSNLIEINLKICKSFAKMNFKYFTKMSIVKKFGQMINLLKQLEGNYNDFSKVLEIIQICVFNTHQYVNYLADQRQMTKKQKYSLVKSHDCLMHFQKQNLIFLCDQKLWMKILQFCIQNLDFLRQRLSFLNFCLSLSEELNTLVIKRLLTNLKNLNLRDRYYLEMKDILLQMLTQQGKMERFRYQNFILPTQLFNNDLHSKEISQNLMFQLDFSKNNVKICPESIFSAIKEQLTQRNILKMLNINSSMIEWQNINKINIYQATKALKNFICTSNFFLQCMLPLLERCNKNSIKKNSQWLTDYTNMLLNLSNVYKKQHKKSQIQIQQNNNQIKQMDLDKPEEPATFLTSLKKHLILGKQALFMLIQSSKENSLQQSDIIPENQESSFQKEEIQQLIQTFESLSQRAQVLLQKVQDKIKPLQRLKLKRTCFKQQFEDIQFCSDNSFKTSLKPDSNNAQCFINVQIYQKKVEKPIFDQEYLSETKIQSMKNQLQIQLDSNFDLKSQQAQSRHLQNDLIIQESQETQLHMINYFTYEVKIEISELIQNSTIEIRLDYIQKKAEQMIQAQDIQNRESENPPKLISSSSFIIVDVLNNCIQNNQMINGQVDIQNNQKDSMKLQVLYDSQQKSFKFSYIFRKMLTISRIQNLIVQPSIRIKKSQNK